MNSCSVSGGTRRTWMRLAVLAAKAVAAVLVLAVLAMAPLAEVRQEEMEMELAEALAAKARLEDRAVLCQVLEDRVDREAKAADRAEP